MAIYIGGKKVISAYINGKQSDVLYINGKKVFVDGDFVYTTNYNNEAKIIELRDASKTKKKIIIPNYTISNGQKYIVSEIGDDVFKDNKNIVTIVLGDNIRRIGARCFNACDNLEYVKNISSNLIYIGSHAFAKSPLSTVILPKLKLHNNDNGLSFLGDENEGPTVLMTAKNFNSSSSVATIPTFTNIIYDYAFHNSSNISSITHGSYSNLTQIGWGAFRASSVQSLSSDLWSTVLNFGSFCFENSALIGATINKNIKEIPFKMFAGSGLSVITFNKDSILSTIGAQAFNECQLSSISIPSSVTTFSAGDAWGIFGGCAKLKTVNFEGKTLYGSSQLNAIPPYCFYNCTNLEKITSEYSWDTSSPVSDVVLPDMVSSVGDYAFYNCGKISSLTFSSQINQIDKYAFANTSLNASGKYKFRYTDDWYVYTNSEHTNYQAVESNLLGYILSLMGSSDSNYYGLFRNH